MNVMKYTAVIAIETQNSVSHVLNHNTAIGRATAGSVWIWKIFVPNESMPTQNRTINVGGIAKKLASAFRVTNEAFTAMARRSSPHIANEFSFRFRREMSIQTVAVKSHIRTMTTKEKAISVIQSLDDDVSLDDVIDRLYLLRKIELGIAQADGTAGEP